jgi:hypothetical protein
MSTPVRVLAFVAALAAVFAAAVGVGTAVGPLTQPEVEDHDSMAAEEAGDHDGGHEGDQVDLPAGLSVTEDGYTLRLADDTAAPGYRVPLAFHVEGPDGHAVTAYDVEHGKRLHLIAVRRDLTGFQHVHPTMAKDGTWTTDLALAPGSWRVFADFTAPGAEGVTLGADLEVAGDYRPAPAPPEARTDRVDGYEVTLTGQLEPGAASEVTLTVTRDGEPVTDLQPYLGAYGHLVALRESDLAYLHVHPEGEPGDGATAAGPDVTFVAEVPSSDRYRLFLDFRHGGAVHTASFAVSSHHGGEEH